MKDSISKTFEEKEKEIYSLWESSGLFNPDSVREYLKEKEI